MKTYILTLLLAALASICIAQAPQAFKYQAVARNGNQLLEGDIQVTFSILQGTPDGMAVFTQEENFILTSEDHGLFTASIGEQSPDAFATIDWGSGPYYLKVELQHETGTVDFPASPILSVPYALHAKSSSDWVNVGDTVLYRENGNIGIGTAEPSTKLEVRKNINTSDLEANNILDMVKVHLSVSDGFIPPNTENRIVFSAQQWNEGGTNIYSAIGSSTENDGPGLYGGGRLSFYTRAGAPGGGTSPGVFERMRIDRNGNVGIGTADPSTKLEVRKIVSTSDLESNNILDMVKVHLSVSDGFIPPNTENRIVFSAQQWNEGGTNIYSAIGSSTENDGPGLYGGGRLSFYTRAGAPSGGTSPGLFERMRIDRNGNVGIGTTTPSEKLHIEGTTKTKILQITGGGDITEKVNSVENLQPGEVVVIDP